MSDMGNKQEDNSELRKALLNDTVDYAIEEQAPDETMVNNQEVFKVGSGSSLNCGQVDCIAAREGIRMVMLVGSVASGKTTIEASIYQMFLDKPVGTYYFAGSESLQGFEERAYLTRIRSKRPEASTPHTNVGETESFLHLRLWDKEEDKIHNFIMADLSGEAFDTYVTCIDKVREVYPFMVRVDFLVGVLDGEKMCDKRRRNSTVSRTVEMIRTFYDADLISENCILQIIFSKFDKLMELEEYDKILSKAKQQIESRLGDYCKAIEFYQVAAMPEETRKCPIGYGLEDLLERWGKKSPIMAASSTPPPYGELTEFDRLCYKFSEVSYG